MNHVMVLIGGVSSGSLNRRFFQALAALNADPSATTGSAPAAPKTTSDKTVPGKTTPATSLNFSIFDIASLPFYSQDLESRLPLPASVLMLREMTAASDAILIVTPEYNRSIPGVLKNALDWGSRISGIPADANPAHPATGQKTTPGNPNIWAGKPTAIIGASPGAIGTFGAQQHLRNICSWLDMPVMNQPAVYFNASSGLMNPSGTPTPDGDRFTPASAAFMLRFLAAFESWTALFQK